MNHAITSGDVLIFVLVIGGLFGAGALIIFILDLMNPFRSGH